MIHRTLALVFVLALVGCKSTARGIDLPPSYEREGIRVSVTEILRTTTKYKGVSGTAWNHTGREVSCKLTFRALNAYAEDVAKAHAEIDRIAPGESRSFRAVFDRSNVGDVKTILAGKVQVGPPR